MQCPPRSRRCWNFATADGRNESKPRHVIRSIIRLYSAEQLLSRHDEIPVLRAIHTYIYSCTHRRHVAPDAEKLVNRTVFPLQLCARAQKTRYSESVSLRGKPRRRAMSTRPDAGNYRKVERKVGTRKIIADLNSIYSYTLLIFCCRLQYLFLSRQQIVCVSFYFSA